MVSAMNVVGALLVILLASKLWRAFVYLIWRPYVITKCFEKQGLKGPPYRLIKGSLPEIRSMFKDAKEITMDVASHDITPRVLPHLHKWSSQYGRRFYFWMGAEVRVLIMEPEQVRQLLSNKFGFSTKLNPGPTLMVLMGKGLVFTEGSDWVRHRRVVSQAFTTDKLKAEGEDDEGWSFVRVAKGKRPMGSSEAKRQAARGGHHGGVKNGGGRMGARSAPTPMSTGFGG